uniref:Fortune-1 n=1 Tax=Cycas edentata TaxID=179041 RepID=Q8VZY5_9SPER|nr:fortune-1 [Cycas edentata]
MSGGKEDRKMDPAQLVIPVLSIATAAAFTFYAVSFSEIREKSFEDLESSDTEKPRLKSSLSSKERRAMKKAAKEQKK